MSEESAITCILTLTNHIKNITGEVAYFKQLIQKNLLMRSLLKFNKNTKFWKLIELKITEEVATVDGK